MKPLLGLLLLVTTSLASYCGNSGVPYSLEVLPSGAPVLGCAQPSCIAPPPDDLDDSSFSSDSHGQMDGFFRDGDREKQQGYLQTNKLRANCSREQSGQLSCWKKNQWVGGIDYIDHPRQPLVLQCCSFEGLRFSQDVGVTTIGVGEAVTGGEVVRDGRQISFDVIANVRKVVDQQDDRIVSYEVTVRRMNCLPDPPEIETPLNEDVLEEIERVLGTANNGSAHLGHEGHAHMEREKKMEKTREREKEYRREKRPRHSVHEHISPLGGGKREEPFVGSFAAPIFTPDKDQERRDRNEAPFETTPPPQPRPRYIPAPSRIPVAPPPPPIQVEPTTPAPFVLPTLPPFTLLPQGNPFNLFQPQQPRPVSQAFGVSQAALSPLPPPTHMHFQHMFQNPAHFNPFFPQQQQPQQDFGAVGAGGQFADNTPPHLAPPTLAPPLGNPQFELPVAPPHQFGFGMPPGHQFQLFQQQPVQNNNLIPPPNTENQSPEVVEPQLPPTNTQLGQLFQPPVFSSLESALHQFQLQG